MITNKSQYKNVIKQKKCGLAGVGDCTTFTINISHVQIKLKSVCNQKEIKL